MTTTERQPLRTGTAYRKDTLWLAAWVHRLSGIALAVFLPLHFLALGLAIEGEASLDGFLKWTENPIVKFAEIGLVVLLSLHFLGGIRILFVENLAWQPGQKAKALLAISAAVITGLLFAINLL